MAVSSRDLPKIRDMLVAGEVPPAELMRPEVAKVIMSFPEPFNS